MFNVIDERLTGTSLSIKGWTSFSQQAPLALQASYFIKQRVLTNIVSANATNVEGTRSFDYSNYL